MPPSLTSHFWSHVDVPKRCFAKTEYLRFRLTALSCKCRLWEELQCLFLLGGFELRKWKASDRTVEKSIPQHLHDQHPLCLITYSRDYVSVLEVEWDTITKTHSSWWFQQLANQEHLLSGNWCPELQDCSIGVHQPSLYPKYFCSACGRTHRLGWYTTQCSFLGH